MPQDQRTTASPRRAASPPRRWLRHGFSLVPVLGITLAGFQPFSFDPFPSSTATVEQVDRASRELPEHARLAFRALEPEAAATQRKDDAALPDAALDRGAQRSGSLDAPDEGSQPVVTVSAPLWVSNPAVTHLWTSPEPNADRFTDLPVGSLMRIEGPTLYGRWPVYYLGDGLLRRPGVAWVDAIAVQETEAPPPGTIEAVDAYANRQLPSWIQAHSGTQLWSGPDDKAVMLTDLPQWSFLKVAGTVRDGRILVEYAGDHATRQPGIGWIDETTVGPAGDPGRWVQSHRPSALYSGEDEKATHFTDLPQWSKLRLLDDMQPGKGRALVEYYGDGGTRAAGVAWVPRADIGPITPPIPVPPPLRPTAASGASLAMAPLGSAGANRQVQTRTFASEAEFINTVGEAARLSQGVTGVPASVTVAQAILESDWGRSGLTRQANNYFGIKAVGRSGTAGYVTMPTLEVANGQAYWVDAPFRAYTSLADSVADHHRFLIENSRYRPAFAYSANPVRFAQAIHRAGYATDPNYTFSLVTLMDRYDLYRYDHP